MHRNDVNFSPIIVTMNKVCSNDVAISPIKIMSNKVRRKNGFFAHRNYAENVRRSNDFLPIEIKSIKE